MGGVHDGGADAVLDDDGVIEAQTANTYFQATVQKDHRSKVRSTISRLREVGRTVTGLTYVTSHIVPRLDQEENLLGEELDISLRIRDAEWLTHHINENDGTRAAFEAYLKSFIAYISSPGSANIIPESQNIVSRTLAVFLRQEVERRTSKASLIESVTDSLILWALEGTDPDAGLLITRDEILSNVEKVLPSAAKFIRGVIDSRLAILSSKSNPTGREIRHYRKKNSYCLTYETRELIEEENIEDDALRIEVLALFEGRAEGIAKDEGVTLDGISVSDVAEITYLAICNTYEHKGLELAAIWEGEDQPGVPTAVAEEVRKIIDQKGITGLAATSLRIVATGIARHAFYDSTEQERLLFGKLNKTYSLLFSLKTEPRIVEYFNNMKGNFELFVGSDIIIRALSEHYLDEKDRMTENLLKMLSEGGAMLMLTQPVSEEVASHIAGTDYEYKNHVMELEPYLTMDIIREIPKILLRAYLYARKSPERGQPRPAGWKSYVENFCSYSDLHQKAGRNQITQYLLRKFSMVFIETTELEAMVNEDELQELTEKVLPTKIKPQFEQKMSRVLAKNDALMVLGVYARRTTNREKYSAGSYGLKTWWLTQESLIVRCTVDVLQKHDGTRYIMRPEFLLNFISFAPSMEEVRRSFRTVFPTMLGIRLSNRILDSAFHELMGKVKEAFAVDEARGNVVLSEYSDKLKGDQLKRYEVTFKRDPYAGDPLSEL